MFIFLDGSAEDKLIFYIVEANKKTNCFVFKGTAAKKGPLFCFDELIKKKKILLKGISGIGVQIGVGRFTATRIAVTFGNTLSYFLHKPIVGIKSFSAEEFFKKIKKAKAGIYLSAKYSGQANIGRNDK